MPEDWMDPFSTEDPAAREREQRRREREARRRAQLGQRVTEAETGIQPPAEPPAPTEPPPQQAAPEPAPTPQPDPTTDGHEPVAPAAGWSQAEPRQPPLPPDRPLPPRPRAKRVRRRRVIAGVIGAVVVLILVFLALLFQPFHGAGHGRVQVRIPRGASASDIADLLDSKGVVSNSTFFTIRLDLSGNAGQIQAGKYTLANDMSYGDAIDALTHKATPLRTTTTTVTVPEGYDRRQIAAVLKQDGVKGNYLDATRSFKGFDPAKYGAKNPTPANLEGFLFPATYKLKPKQTAKDLAAQQLLAFKRDIRRVNMGYAKSKNLNVYDVVKIASVVQREAGATSDYKTVAGVIYNRLHDRMPLQADATIRFAENNYTKALTYSDLHLDSPYNSYTHTGLPPGPISNPGLAALEAAAHPAHVPYLFYVTKPGACGKLLFATTYAQAQRQQARYRSARAAAGGKSPTSC